MGISEEIGKLEEKINGLVASFHEKNKQHKIEYIEVVNAAFGTVIELNVMAKR